MSKAMELFAKNLANGMSRRRALWRLLAALGVLGFLTGKKALAGVEQSDCLSEAEAAYEICLSKGGTQSFCLEQAESCYEKCLEGRPCAFC